MLRLFFSTIVLLLISSRLFAITPEALARLSEKGAADKRKVEQQLNLEDLHYQLNINAIQSAEVSKETVDQPVKEYKRDTAVIPLDTAQTISPLVEDKSDVRQKAQSTKYSSATMQFQKEHPQNQRNAQRQAEQYSYQTSPQNTASNIKSRSPNKYVTYSDAVEPDNKKYFTIRRGTWIKAELRRDVNNAEPGDVELYLSQEVHGEKHSLPIDTQLFANKGFNAATQRLDMITTYAITPSGREFVLKARIYDTYKVSGLVGIIDADDSKIVERGTTSTLASLGSGVLYEVGGGSLVGKALSSGGQSIINDQQNVSKLDTQQQITIFVAPQTILLRVEETF